MSRSLKKGPYVYHKLLKRVQELNENGERKVMKIWQRASMITPEFIGHNVEVYNGKKWFPVFISEELVGHRFGEFAPTRTFRSHSRDERKAKR